MRKVQKCHTRNSLDQRSVFFAAVITLSTAATNAFAEPIMQETTPVNGDPFRDYRISGCGGTKALAAFRYLTNQGDVLELSDICLDEEEGEIVSIENASDFTLVEESNDARAYEILSTGDDQSSRVRVDIGPDEDAPGCGTDQDEFHSVHYNIPGKAYISANSDAYAALARGYTVGTHSLVPQKAEASGFYLALRPLSLDGGPNNAFANLNADAYGDFAMKDGAGNVTLNKGDDTWVGEADGALRLDVDEHGSVFINGDFSYKSRRLAGHHPDEWVTMTGTIPYARGHILGEDGVLLKAYGLATGTYMDASGREHTFRSSAYLVGCFSWSSVGN